MMKRNMMEEIMKLKRERKIENSGTEAIKKLNTLPSSVEVEERYKGILQELKGDPQDS